MECWTRTRHLLTGGRRYHAAPLLHGFSAHASAWLPDGGSLRTCSPPLVPRSGSSCVPVSGERTSSRRWRLWPDVVLLALGALLMRLPSMFAPTQLGYDDGG